MKTISIFYEKAWSPYLVGVVIGALQVPVFLYLHSSLGTSSSFGAITCFVNSTFGSSSSYPSCLPTLKPLLQIGIIVGIFFGAFISSTLAGTRRSVISPIWGKLLGSRALSKRFILAFLSGFFLLMGARIANGCTSGNGISGIALQFIGSFIVIASMFISGIIVSLIYNKL